MEVLLSFGCVNLSYDTVCRQVVTEVLEEAVAFVLGVEKDGHSTLPQNISDNLLTVQCHFTGNSSLQISCIRFEAYILRT